MTPEQLLEAIKNAPNEQARQQLIRQHYTAFDQDELNRLAGSLRTEFPDTYNLLTSFTDQFDTVGLEDEPEVQAQIAADEAAQREQQDSQFEAAATDPFSPGGEGITEEEAAAGQAQGASEDFTSDIIDPVWVMEQFNGGTVLNDEQRERIVSYFSEKYDQAFVTYDDLLSTGVLDQPSQQVLEDLEAAIMDVEPEQALQVRLPKSGDMFTVPVSQWKGAQAAFGLGDAELARVIRLADSQDIRDARGKDPAWQAYASFLKMTGVLDPIIGGKPPFPGKPPTDGEEDVQSSGLEALGDFLGKEVGPAITSGGVTPFDNQEFFEETIGSSIDPDVGSVLDPTDERFRELGFGQSRGVDAGAPRSEQNPFGPNKSVSKYFKDAFQRGLDAYGDDGLAWIYTVDQRMAGRIARGGATRDDRRLLMRYIADAGFPNPGEWYSQMVGLGAAEFAANQNLADLLNTGQGAGDQSETPELPDFGAGAAPVRTLPDSAQLDEAMRDLYQSIFLEEPDEATLATFRSKINGAIRGAEPGESVDVGARAQQFIRDQDQYEVLYGNKDPGQSEQEYQQTFRQGVSQILGSDTTNLNPLRLGMQSGNQQTAIGAAAGTAEAFDSSTFLGRLARAGQNISEYT